MKACVSLGGSAPHVQTRRVIARVQVGGLRGKDGDPAPPGAGGGDLNYRHVQSSASDTWTITHNLGKRPSVSVFDSAGEQIIGGVVYLSDNTVRLEFSAAFGGEAYCN